MMEYLAPILALVVMEGLLSADNALVLAIMARKLKDPKQQKKALIYGMWGAVAFRALFILVGTILVKLWFVKVIGALYLAKIVVDHFRGSDHADDDQDGMLDKYQQTFVHKILGKFGMRLSIFWSVIISIELMDVAFSADSILAAFAVSTKFLVLFTGGVLGIAMMRGVAGVFTKLIAKVPEMETTAFILIAIIAVKMGLGTVHHFAEWFGYHMKEIEIHELLFFGILVATFLATFIVHAFRGNKHGTGTNLSA
jgi:YkoY family integral membrane protein